MFVGDCTVIKSTVEKFKKIKILWLNSADQRVNYAGSFLVIGKKLWNKYMYISISLKKRFSVRSRLKKIISTEGKS